jgi:hypothetical protein
MNLKRWSTIILMMGLFLVLSPLGSQADPYPPCGPHANYHRPHGNAYGWHGQRPHGSDHHQGYYRGSRMGMHHPRPYVQKFYAGPPQVAYVTPVAPIVGIQPYQPPQPVFSPPASPGLHGQITF